MFSNINHGFIGLMRAEQLFFHFFLNISININQEHLHPLVKSMNPEEIGTCLLECVFFAVGLFLKVKSCMDTYFEVLFGKKSIKHISTVTGLDKKFTVTKIICDNMPPVSWQKLPLVDHVTSSK